MTNLKAGLGLSGRGDIFCADADHLQKRFQQVNKLFSLIEFFNSTPIQLVTLVSQNGFTTTKITIAINKIVGASLAILKKRAE